LIRTLSKYLIVGALVLAAAVIIPLLRAKRVFAPHTPLAFGNPAPRPSLRRRLNRRQALNPREAAAPRADGAALASRDTGHLPESHGDVPLPRGRRGRAGAGETVERAESVHLASAHSAIPTHAAAARAVTTAHASAEVSVDFLPPDPVRLRARPEARAVPRATTPPPPLASRDAADVPAPPPRLLTC
jgi:hypothetical protein